MNFLLATDLFIFAGWFIYFIVALIIVNTSSLFNPYRSIHLSFLVHILATLRLCSVVEIPTKWYWWNFLTFSFALMMDIINVCLVQIYLTRIEYVSWQVSMAFAYMFMGMSIMIWIWYLSKK